MKFFKLPEILFSEDKYKNMSLEAKVLYSFLLDRLELSKKNNFVDKNGIPFVIFTRKEAAKKLGTSERSAARFFEELIKNELLIRAKQAVGKPYMLYVKSCTCQETKMTVDTGQKEHTIYTDNIYTENNYTHSVNKKEGGTDEALLNILENCELEIWNDDTGKVLQQGITELYNTESITAHGRKYNKSEIRQILSELDADCLIYAVDCIKEKQGRIKNPALYLKTAILNAKRDYLAFEAL